MLVRHAEPGSAIFRATFGEQATWGVTDHLLAALIDLTNILVWFKSKKGTPRPKPVRRPTDRVNLLDEVSGSGALSGEGGHIGTAMTIDELNALLRRSIQTN